VLEQKMFTNKEKFQLVFDRHGLSLSTSLLNVDVHWACEGVSAVKWFVASIGPVSTSGLLQ